MNSVSATAAATDQPELFDAGGARGGDGGCRRNMDFPQVECFAARNAIMGPEHREGNEAQDTAGCEPDGEHEPDRDPQIAVHGRDLPRGLEEHRSVVHWLNPTILRKHDGVWHWTMWSLALAGIALSLMGVWLGAVRYVNLKRIRRPGLSPFTGWLRWHHIIGLFAAIIVLNWICSGWLSVDRGTFFSSDQPTLQRLERLRGISLAEAARAFPTFESATPGLAREIEFTALGGRPALIVRDDTPQFSRVVSVDGAGTVNTSAVIPDELLLSAVRSAWSPVGVLGIQRIAEDDAYRLRTVPWPETARRILLDDAGHTWVQIDAASGQIISIMDTSRRVYRWIVAGPHNLDFPVFNHAGPLRHILILVATSIGFAFSCTGIVLGIKRLRKSLS